ncbi:hypothetical protein AA906_14425 [Geobacillus stearothermophilus]|nr:hypothetical protein AA906_14425 [Geobacillus stearothermophilus]
MLVHREHLLGLFVLLLTFYRKGALFSIPFGFYWIINTPVRLKNPDDQRFITKTSDMLTKADIDELPSLSTGEALITGRSIPAPLLVKVGTKALVHGGQSPEVVKEWGVFGG